MLVQHSRGEAPSEGLKGPLNDGEPMNRGKKRAQKNDVLGARGNICFQPETRDVSREQQNWKHLPGKVPQ